MDSRTGGSLNSNRPTSIPGPRVIITVDIERSTRSISEDADLLQNADSYAYAYAFGVDSAVESGPGGAAMRTSSIDIGTSIGTGSDLDSHSYTRSDTTISISSGSTIPGPGALTGKAIKLLGTKALGLVERFAIAKVLAGARRCFPHWYEPWFDRDRVFSITSGNGYDGVDVSYGVEEVRRMYDVLLELTRPELYAKGVRKEAMDILMMQIFLKETGILITRLLLWPRVELELFLREATTLVKPMRTEKRTAYFDFLIQLAQISKPLYTLILTTSKPIFHEKEKVHTTELAHPLCVLHFHHWPEPEPNEPRSPFPTLSNSKSKSVALSKLTREWYGIGWRRTTWLYLGEAGILERLDEIEYVLEERREGVRGHEPGELEDLCVDLMEMVWRRQYGTNVSSRALRLTVKAVRLGEEFSEPLGKLLGHDVACRTRVLNGMLFGSVAVKAPLTPHAASVPVSLVRSG